MAKTPLVYLDYAAATPLDEQVLRAMQPYFTDIFYNPSASYDRAREVKAVIQKSRSEVAATIGAKASEIVFTAGGTEANNLALTGVMANFPESNLVLSTIEHPSVYEPASKYSHKLCPVDTSGLIKPAELSKLIDDQTVLVSIIYVSNEIGVIQPLKDIAKIIQSIREDRLTKGSLLPLYLHTDACQAANYLDLHVSRLGVDLMTLNGGKIYGPKQSGALFIKAGTKISPIIRGGGQERDLRSGTENVPAIVGFSEAIQKAQAERKSNTVKLSELQAYFLESLKKLKNCRLNGSLTNRVVNNIHVTFDGVDNEELLIKLDQHGIMAAAGSACSAAKGEPSTVLKALGLSDKSARSSVRFSLGKGTTKEQLDHTLAILQKLLLR